MINWGTVPAGSVLPFVFASYDGATGASEAISGLAITDIEIFKGLSMTQRSSDAGFVLTDTDGIDIDGIVGLNGFSIDTGNNTDAGFYAVGSFFTVVVASITADGQTVNFIAGTFRLGPAESSAGVPKVDTTHFGGSAGTFAAGIPEVKVASIAADAVTASAIAANAIGAAEIADGALTAAKFASGAFDAVWTVAARTLTSFGTLTADVWSAATRLLTAGTNIVLAKGVGVTGFNDLSAAQVNAEADTALADYDAPTKAELDSAHATTDGLITTVDTVVDGIAAKTVNLPVDPADQSLIIAATDAIVTAITALNNVSTAQLAAALNTYDAPTKAELDSAVALLATAANLALVKTKTDSLTFTVANVLDANLQRINDVALVGTGVLGDEWGPA